MENLVENSSDLVKAFSCNSMCNSFDFLLYCWNESMVHSHAHFHVLISRAGPNCGKMPSCYFQHETSSQKLARLTELPDVNAANQELGFCFVRLTDLHQKLSLQRRGVGEVAERRKEHK